MKNVGAWLASYTFAGIQTDPNQFLFSLLVFMLVTTPADLYLLNHWTGEEKEETPA